MILRHNYFTFPKAISKENCQKIIQHGLTTMNVAKQSDPKSIVATTYGSKEKGTDEKLKTALGSMSEQAAKKKGINLNTTYVRDSYTSWINDKWIYDLVLPHVHTANKEAGWNFDIKDSEMFQFTVYKPGGFYGWHSDGRSDHFGSYKKAIPGVNKKNKHGKFTEGLTDNDFMVGLNRKISVTINLTDKANYKGGDLKFDMGTHTAKRYHVIKEAREQGSIIVFPSFLMHQVTPVTKGTRYSLVMWTLGPPFK